MKKVVIAAAILCLTAVVPSLAKAGAMAPGPPGGPGGMPCGGMPSPMMLNPQHMLMKAYHRNVMVFARVLDRVARQGETVPPDVARTAIAEMRRSVDQMEKERAGSMQNVPPQMQKMMDQHLVAVKNQLRELENLAKNDRIPSQEVLKHTQPLLTGCDSTQCNLMPRKGMMRGRGMRYGWGGCDCMQVSPEHRRMMEQMRQKVNAQDQELTALVAKMERAPRDKKVDLLADIVARMVKQRTEFIAQMEKMQHEHMMRHQQMMQRRGAMMPAPTMTGGEGQESYGGDQDADDDSDMGMENMNMQDMNTQGQQ